MSAGAHDWADRVSDEATGLPPLEVLEPADAVILLAYATSEGVVANGATGATLAVRYLHVRGLNAEHEGGGPDWVQVHVAIPVDILREVLADLAVIPGDPTP